MSFTESMLPQIVEENHDGLLGKHQSWSRVRLGLVCSILNGFAFRSEFFNSSDGMPLARIRDVLSGRTEAFYSGDYEKQYIVELGDILVGMDGDFHCGYWHGAPALLNQRVCKVTADERFYDRRFLRHVLPGYLKAINDHTSSVTVKHLSSETITNIPLPLPSLVEQRAMVAKIEELFSELDNGIVQLQTVKQQLKRYRQAVLKAGFEGKLTAEWRAEQQAAGNLPDADELLDQIKTEREEQYQQQLREWKKAVEEWEATGVGQLRLKKPQKPNKPQKLPPLSKGELANLPGLPEGWIWVTLEHLVEGGRSCAYGVLQPGSDVPGGIPLVRVGDISEGRVCTTQLKRIAPDISSQYERTLLRGGEFLITLVGAIGRTAVASSELVGANTARAVGVVPLVKTVEPRFIEMFFRQADKVHEMTNKAHEVARKTLNLEDVRRATVAVAPKQEQRQVVHELEACFSVLDELHKAVDQGLEQAEALRQSILKKAFEGQLLSEGELGTIRNDPEYEPADRLLERIRAERSPNKQASRIDRTPNGTHRTILSRPRKGGKETVIGAV